MKFKIGFTAEKATEKKVPESEAKAPEEAPSRESLVRVYFPQRGFDCTYYNNLFDLHVGDLVYVDGKLEGKRGKVIDVSYHIQDKAVRLQKSNCKDRYGYLRRVLLYRRRVVLF